MRYVKARITQEVEAKTYRIYVTDALKVLGNLNMRYADMLKKPHVETRTKEEIVDSIRRKLK